MARDANLQEKAVPVGAAFFVRCYLCAMSKSPVLGLRMPTDPRWANIVERNLGDVLSDHAWCEQKAASNAITTMVRFPEYADVVDEMTRIALEELTHFRMVVDKLRERGLELT